MKRFALLSLSVFSLALILCSCATDMDVKRTAVCNKLRSDLVFNGTTSNTRQANIQNSETPLAQKTYDKNDCSS